MCCVLELLLKRILYTEVNEESPQIVLRLSAVFRCLCRCAGFQVPLSFPDLSQDKHITWKESCLFFINLSPHWPWPLVSAAEV